MAPGRSYFHKWPRKGETSSFALNPKGETSSFALTCAHGPSYHWEKLGKGEGSPHVSDTIGGKGETWSFALISCTRELDLRTPGPTILTFHYNVTTVASVYICGPALSARERKVRAKLQVLPLRSICIFPTLRVPSPFSLPFSFLSFSPSASRPPLTRYAFL